jgi:hypothetical protein
MLDFFCSYDQEFLDLHDHLKNEWNMKDEYSRPFLIQYKKNIGRIVQDGNSRVDKLLKSKDVSDRIAAREMKLSLLDYALVNQAYVSWMGDVRSGNCSSKEIEMAIAAILFNRTDLVMTVDGGFGNWVNNTFEQKYPSLLEAVFDYT